MPTIFEIITEEFLDDTKAIQALVATSNGGAPHTAAKVRIAAARSATLLSAATFEEFVREMARAYARKVVASTDTFSKLPPKLAATAWKRTMDGLGKIRFTGQVDGSGAESVFVAASARFSAIHAFCHGDLTQDIYQDLIHNEFNMRPSEINGLFKVCGLGDVCSRVASKSPMLEFFGEVDSGKSHGKLLAAFEDFFERRNGIAHSLNSGRSSGPEQIGTDLDMMDAFAQGLCSTLGELEPASSSL